jgi:uncharacterized membrane protein YdbT with pleckstrin-like domain
MKRKAKICALPYLLPYIFASIIFLPIAVATAVPTHGLLLLVWVVIVFIALVHAFVLRLGKQVYVTDHAVGFKTGVFSKDITEMSLSKIETIEIHQPFIGRMFGYGALRFRGTGASNDFTPYVKDPKGFKNIVTDRAEQTRAPA